MALAKIAVTGRRGLLNLRNTLDALEVLEDEKARLGRELDPDESAEEWQAIDVRYKEMLAEEAGTSFPEDPIEAFRRCVYVAPFWEDNFKDMADLCGIDRMLTVRCYVSASSR